MCAPLLLAAAPAALSALGGASGVGMATAGLGAVSSIMGFFGQQAARSAAIKSANLNFAAKDEQAQRENAQLSEQQTEQSLTDAVSYAQSFGRIATSASAQGLGQYSSHQLISANAAGYNRTLGIKDKNYDNKRLGIATDLEGAHMQRSSAIAAAPKANLGSLAMSLAGNALQGVSTFAALGGKFGVPAAGGAPSPDPFTDMAAGNGRIY